MRDLAQRPRSVALFERLYVSSQAASILAIFLHYGTLRSAAIANGSSPAGPIVGVFLILVISVPLWFFIVRRASNIAKWITIILFAIGLLGLPSSLSKTLAVGPAYFVLSLLALVLSIGSVIMLFKQDSVFWLKSNGKALPVDPEIFS